MTTLISIATYKRPEMLRALLESLCSVDGIEKTRLCVIDNDSQGSAREVCQAFPDLVITYEIESTPGIAAARNRGLQNVRASDEFIIFVDDDERVTNEWLSKLHAAQLKYRADVVSGPVISVFEENAPEWILRSGLIQRARFVSGSEVRSPATNNTLVRLQALNLLTSPRFSEEFSLTGGSDTELFYRLRQAGARMIWCDEAIVYEDVPAERANLRWIFRRGIREGNVSGRLRLRSVSKGRLFLDGIARTGYGFATGLLLLLAGRGLNKKSFAYFTRGLGWMGVCMNRLVDEYARTPKKPNGVTA